MRILGLLVAGMLAFVSTNVQAYESRRGGAGRCEVPGPHGQLRLVRVRSKQECRAVQQREAQRYGRQRQSGQYRRQHRSAPLGAIIGGIVGAAIGHQFDR
ncbi:hypothetical protein COB18_00545 [Candidatus Kaiserbacteria bacterium]|nr:MAG: hypothetical protein COB18_00545 [Candidatus Kaiserbacteria bacterium]